MQKYSALIVDTMPVTGEDKSPFEGVVVSSFMKNLGWDVKTVFKTTKRNLLAILFQEGYAYDIIHFATHGDKEAIYTGKGHSVSIDDVRDVFWDILDEEEEHLDFVKLVVNTGCNTGTNDWGELFVRDLGVRNYIALRKKLAIEEGIIFPMLIYTAFDRRKTVEKAFVILWDRAGIWNLY